VSYSGAPRSETKSRIKKSQPLQGATWSHDLAELSNADKHRLVSRNSTVFT